MGGEKIQLITCDSTGRLLIDCCLSEIDTEIDTETDINAEQILDQY